MIQLRNKCQQNIIIDWEVVLDPYRLTGQPLQKTSEPDDCNYKYYIRIKPNRIIMQQIKRSPLQRLLLNLRGGRLYG